MEELKTCPFCGSTNIQISPYDGGKTVICMYCLCQTATYRGDEALENATAAWNRRAAPENKPLTLEQLRRMERGWVWLIDVKHPEYDGWYNVRPFHDGSGGIELYGVDNNYYECAIMAGSVKVYARNPEGNVP